VLKTSTTGLREIPDLQSSNGPSALCELSEAFDDLNKLIASIVALALRAHDLKPEGFGFLGHIRSVLQRSVVRKTDHLIPRAGSCCFGRSGSRHGGLVLFT